MSEKYLDFTLISGRIKFNDVLNWKNIPYSEKGGELKGETKNFKFIINIEKNIFFSPDSKTAKGSVINFLAMVENIGLREAAKELKLHFLDEPDNTKRDIPELELHYVQKLEELGISEAVAKEYEVGYVKQRSIMQGKIAFKVYDEHGDITGYVGWHPENDKWFFPKNFKRPLYNLNKIKSCDEVIVTVSPFVCLSHIGIGKTNCVSLMSNSMTDTQEHLLYRFEKIILLHPEPDNIILRLAKKCFVKSPVNNISS
ncbi:MAG: hypothetical protein A2X61_00760 [Ignavibacteria bacterium GWB2_35_12]|nr:MAG: hypothetical protein A2X61_00760 [Ignavibacteria bacterium GWB2_35_12]OGU87532.1 MAG: hypothetical protein A2220_15520 [Ignavibacteria bacterium RIFOXYA2_FULL_35_10]OGV21723.1 MAG: hypothetical protein A2475_03985 [Ignavibacteria bacterium RIFOXYC2_FULL_35_21]